MKKLILLLTCSVVLFTAQLCFAQTHLFGKVVEVVDGRSFVFEAPTGRVNGELQYVEVPVVGQALQTTVKEHLGALTIGKSAEFQVTGMSSGKFAGRLIIDGIDISIQMLRDGAAWLLPREKTGQTVSEFASYTEIESLAKADHLGVWSVPNLKPTSGRRAENKEKGQQAQQQQSSRSAPKAKIDIVSQFQTVTRPDRVNVTTNVPASFEKEAWLDVLAGTGKEVPGVKTYNDPQGRFSTNYTSVAFVNLATLKSKQRLECRVMHVELHLPNGSSETVYLIGFGAISDDYNFSKHASRLSINADGQTISAGLFKGFRGKAQFGAGEVMLYQINRRFLLRIAAAKKVQIRIDNVYGSMGSDLQLLIGQLVAATD